MRPPRRCLLTRADGYTERLATLALIEKWADAPCAITLGADKGYDTSNFVNELRSMNVRPHVARRRRGSAIDGRTTRHQGYAASQRIRKRIEEAFGWIKTIGGMRRPMLRGPDRVGRAFTFVAAAYNLVRLPKLLATERVRDPVQRTPPSQHRRRRCHSSASTSATTSSLHFPVRDRHSRPYRLLAMKEFDPVLMFKILFLQTRDTLSDDATEFQKWDGHSLTRFLGFGFEDDASDAKTVWFFCEHLTRVGAIDISVARL